jgi:hypothetical protein
MRTRSLGAVALCAALALSGCIDTATKLSVKTDGSGTIEKTIVISKTLVDFVENMGAKGDATSIESGMVSESSLKAEAAQMGSDVTFVSAQKITTSKGNGYKALYSFKDVTKVKLNQNPAGDVTLPSSPGGAGGGAGQAATAELVTFKFTKGTPAVLTIVSPKIQPSTSTAKAAQPQTSSADAEQMMQALKPLYADLRIALYVEVQGKISETNATFVEGSTVTLMDMDFGKILADDAVFKKLAASQTQSVKEVQELVKTIPGVKLDMQENITVTFR